MGMSQRIHRISRFRSTNAGSLLTLLQRTDTTDGQNRLGTRKRIDVVICFSKNHSWLPQMSGAPIRENGYLHHMSFVMIRPVP